MVVQIHTGEFYYIGPGGSVLDTAAAHWVGWLNSLFRCCVPLFVMISGVFLFPVRNEGAFFRKRFSRVLIPFVVWCVIYAFYLYWQGTTTLQGALLNILKIPVNFGTDVGHLWFVYMLLGIYLVAPVLSPWVESASRRSMERFLALWAVSLTIPYIHLVFPEIWGEAFWNSTPMLYYFSGYIGYAVAGAYIKRFHMQPSRSLSLAAVVLIVSGYAITASGFLHRLSTVQSLPKLELTWGFETINVAMITVGFFLLFKDIQPAVPDSAPWKLIRNISQRSYGMYLAHIIVLNAVYGLLNTRLGSSPIIKVPTIAIVAFLGTYALISLIALLPKSKWIVG
jgi:surface polysaccharide O-acyltransferase-like enzyme